ncbi:CHAT domain-containing protein [Vararia minispora EC-137]|uniref:CHAT domain-containing protein n=1 Tax=Vararia minispora EC-137 TaxID=1314806 RepID=A0ACB8QTS7_9AGAM|nr:CHAT domain-containing protein [Vararia minispora EC-137]
MANVLTILWRDLCQPVTDALRRLGCAVGSRVWWCPGGQLTSLPLHAAGPHGIDLPGFFDLFVSSYTPSISSLIAARTIVRDGSEVDERLLLGIGQSDALPHVKEEVKALQDIFSDHAFVLDGAAATPSSVLAGLSRYPWVHFACHGSLNPDLPFECAFELYGGTMLPLQQILQLHLEGRAEGAFLATCHSASSANAGTPDEALTLASAMQFCGFRAVVGSLWAMNDEDGPALAREYYSHLLNHGAKDCDTADVRMSARALHAAVKSLRDNGLPLHRWATFVHWGV